MTLVQPDHLQPDPPQGRFPSSPRYQAGTRRRRSRPLPGPKAALRHARHHRRRDHPRQLRLPRHGRGRVQRDRQLQRFGASERGVAHPPDRRERNPPRRVHQGGRPLRLSDEWPHCGFRFTVTSVAETASPKNLRHRAHQQVRRMVRRIRRRSGAAKAVVWAPPSSQSQKSGFGGAQPPPDSGRVGRRRFWDL